MNITYISQSTFPSPTVDSIQVFRMCGALSHAGVQVRLLALDKRERLLSTDPFEYYGSARTFEIQKIAHFPVRENRLRYLASTFLAYRRIRAALARSRPDLVYGRYLPGCLAAAGQGIPTVFEAHGPVWTSAVQARLFRRLLRTPAFRGIVVISEALKRLFCQQGISPALLHVAPDAADLPPDTARAANWPGRPGALQIGYTGSLFAGRGIELIIQAAQALPENDFHLIGGEEEDLARWNGQPVPANVFFHGYVAPAEVHRHRNCCDVLLAPYQKKVTIRGQGDTSAFMSPLKIFEYMASTRAIVVSDLPALREVFDHDSALLVPPDDPDAWTGALRQLADPALRERLAQNAHKVFLENYTWDARAKHLLDFISSAGDKPS